MNPETQLERIKKNFELARRLGLEDDLADLEVVNPTTTLQLQRFITENPAMLEMKKRVKRLSVEDDTVLITGETGTGKEIIAGALHGARSGRFIAINVTSLPDYLLESELFGHVKGSFTGAVDDKDGLFKAAAKGTIFLDEIGDMPMTLQAKLLRVLQEKRIRPVGSNEELTISCRILCATHRDLLKLVKENSFREDLYHRLTTFEIAITPLRERRDDIDELLDSWDPHHDIPEETLVTLRALEYRGNVRELQKYFRRWQVFKEI